MLTGRKFLQQRRGQPVEECPVPLILGVILVQQVLRSFGVGIGKLRIVKKRRRAAGTSPVVSPTYMRKGIGSAG
jgi:hypothetical protein